MNLWISGLEDISMTKTPFEYHHPNSGVILSEVYIFLKGMLLLLHLENNCAFGFIKKNIDTLMASLNCE